MYTKIKIYENNFKDKKFIKNAKILGQYSFCLFACFVAFLIYVCIFAITVVLSDSFNKVYFKWVGDLADRAMSILFFTTICFNLWEEKELLHFPLEADFNDSNREKSGTGNNMDLFRKKSKEDNNNEDDKNKKEKSDNLPKNEEVKIRNSFGEPNKN